MNKEDAQNREKYLRSGQGKRYLRNRLKRLRFLTGFTVIEVLIATGLLTIAVSGVILILTNVSNYGSSSEARSMAVNYAQEAMDAVNNYRDNNYCQFFQLSGLYRISNTIPGKGWELSAGGAEDVYKLGSTETKATQMTRKIEIKDIPGIPAIEGRQIIVTMNWTTKGAPTQDYVVTSESYNWK